MGRKCENLASYENRSFIVFMLSYLVTLRNQVLVIVERVYMPCSNLVPVYSDVQEADQLSDFSPPLELFWKYDSQILTASS